MGNSLLDFVMALVRDPDVAAHYAADPAGALAAAGLPDVTTADVSSLMPVVTDSLAMSSPGFGTVPAVADAANVWASGAATAAFDAFGIDVPTPASAPIPSVDSALNSVDHINVGSVADSATADDGHLHPPLDAPVVPDAVEPVDVPWADHLDTGAAADPHHPGVAESDLHPHDPPAFDLF